MRGFLHAVTADLLLRGFTAGAAAGCVLLVAVSLSSGGDPAPLEERGFVRVVAAAEALTEYPGWSRTFPEQFSCSRDQPELPFCIASHHGVHAVVATIEGPAGRVRCLLPVFEPDPRTREEMMEDVLCASISPRQLPPEARFS